MELPHTVVTKGSSQMLFDERFPRLTGQVVRSISLYWANFAFAPLPGSSVSVANHNLCLFPDVCAACQTLGAFFKSKPWHQSLLGRAPDRGLLAGLGWAADLTFCGSSHSLERYQPVSIGLRHHE